MCCKALKGLVYRCRQTVAAADALTYAFGVSGNLSGLKRQAGRFKVTGTSLFLDATVVCEQRDVVAPSTHRVERTHGSTHCYFCVTHSAVCRDLLYDNAFN